MIYSLPSNNLYGNIPEQIILPDNWEVHISKIKGYESKSLDSDALKELISRPVGAPSIREGASGKKVLLLLLMI